VVLEENLDQDVSDTNQITENETSATNSSSNDSSNESQESCGKCVVSSNRHDMDSSMGSNREAAGGGMVKEENHQVVREENSATKMKPPLNHSDIIDIAVEPEDAGKIEVNSRVLVWWPYEKRYYSGTVDRIKVNSSDPDPHHILYDDGDREWTNLCHRDFKHIDAAAATSGGLNNSDTSASKSAASVSVSQLVATCSGMIFFFLQTFRFSLIYSTPFHLQTRETPRKSKSKAKKRKVSEDSTLSKQEQISKCKRKKERCQGEDEMVNKDTKQNEKKKRKKERTASYHHLVVPIGTDVINANGNVNDNGNAHEDVVEEHTVAATELVEEGSITDKDGNVTSFAEMPALHSPPPVNSKMKHSEAYESKLHEKWNKRFMELVEYKETNGHCNIHTKNISLGMWIWRQRRLFKSKKLEADRCEKLVEIGFKFEDPRSDHEKWNRHFMELVKYKQKNGHCNIPTTNGSLGNWIAHQRALYRSKKLKEDRHEKLVEIGFAFVTALEFKGKLDQQWQDMYQKLLEHKETKGHCFDLPKTLPLGRWLPLQRWLYRNGKLRDDRAEKLLSIGFDDKKGLKKGGAVGVREASSGQPPRKKRKEEDLGNDSAAITYDEGEKGIDDINSEDDINDNDNANEEIVEKHTVAATELVEEGSITDKDGNVTSFAEMPALHSPPPVNSKRKLSEAYESKLHEKWNKCFMELVEYKEKNGDCNIPIKKNRSLGTWIYAQRTLFKSNKLKADRHEKLVGIGFVFEDPRFASDHEKWNRHFMELVKYKQKNGHCNIPITNGFLGTWVTHQRRSFRSKKLKEDRHEKLVEIGFAFEDVTALEFKGKLDQQWQDMYQKLLEHKQMKGHCFHLPQTLPLGRWLRTQRWLYRNGNLRDDRAEKLLSIGFNDKKGLKKGGAVGVRDASSGQPPRKKRKVDDLDNDLAAITHDEGEKGIDDINDNGDVNDNVNAHEEIVEEHAVAATELVEVEIKEGQK